MSVTNALELIEGFTVTSILKSAPVQPLETGWTVYVTVATCFVLLINNCLIIDCWLNSAAAPDIALAGDTTGIDQV